MKIKMTVAEKAIKIEAVNQEIEFLIGINDFQSYELDTSESVLVFPIGIRERSDDWLTKARKKQGFFKNFMTYLLANEVSVYLSKEYQNDLIIRSLYDFCTSILIGRVVRVLDANDSSKNLLKAKHVMSIENLEKRYKQTKDEDYLLAGMEV